MKIFKSLEYECRIETTQPKAVRYALARGERTLLSRSA